MPFWTVIESSLLSQIEEKNAIQAAENKLLSFFISKSKVWINEKQTQMVILKFKKMHYYCQIMMRRASVID